MDIRIFAGAHRVAGMHIEEILKKNRVLLKEQGILVVPISTQLTAMKHADQALEDNEKPKVILENYLKTVTKGEEFEKLVVLDRRRSGSVTRPTRKNMIYPKIRYAFGRFARFLPQGSYKIFMGVRSPATFLPSCYSESLANAKVETFDEFLLDTDLKSIRWSETLERAVRSFEGEEDASDTRIVTWRLEDYPCMWRDVIGALTGVENPQDLVGDAVPTNRGLSLYGSHLMYDYLQKHHAKSAGDFRKVRDAFLEKFAEKKKPEPLPKGDAELLNTLNYAYEDDWYYIERMENVVALSARPVI
jgi:hypothetical protein